MTKSDEKWLHNFECLKAYIDEHHHLPPKSATDGKWMLNFAKYTRKTIKEGKGEEWKKMVFEGLMATRDFESHTGGRRKKSPLSNEGEDCPSN